MNEIKRIQIWGKPEEDVFEVGDVVETTTSEFEFNNVSGQFERNLTWLGEVKGRKVASDYSNFDVGNSCNGGCYGFDSFKIIEIVDRI